MLTFLPLEKIDKMDEWEGSQLNTAKEILAFELTKLVHGEEEATKAQNTARAIFAGGGSDANMPTTELSADDLTDGKIGVLDMMLKAGLEEEAREAYLSNRATSAQAIGHKELFDYFEGNKTLEEAVDFLKMQTRRYAKRQLTWFRRNPDINWLYRDTEDIYSKAERLVEEFLKEG